MARLLAGLLLAGAAVVALVVGFGGGRREHRVSFVVAEAADLMPGLKVRAAGQHVGEIASLSTVDGGRAARVELKLFDDEVWPLPRDTRLRLRFGGTIAYSQRYVDLRRGTATGPAIPEGGAIARANVEVPVEFDELFGTFGPRTRENLRATIDAAGRALAPAAAPIRDALPPLAGLVEQGRGVFADVGADRSALATLVRSSDRIVSAAHRATPGLSPLLRDASTTFAALGGGASDMRRLLARLPSTLTSARTTLRRADTTLATATQVTSRLRPGVERLIDITPPLRRALGTLVAVAPDARAALATARRAAPDLTGLLNRATALMPDVTSVGEQAAPQLRCVRPYAPEIAGWASTWTGFLALGDGKDKYARLFNSIYPFPNDTPFGIPTASKLVPGSFASYAFPRPPGANAGQPWFQPECGVTAAGLDPAKNPEAG
ncbi:MAG TPA: MlaD family protein [Solirubrobacteraceae bacterium]